jgi:hypothetical protein
MTKISSSRGRLMRRALIPIASLALGVSCTENLPVGPNTFAASLAIVVAHDTIVVGDSSKALATAKDSQGRQIQNLSFAWVSADEATVGFAATVTPDSSQGRGRTLVAKRTGRVAVTLTLPDPRFVTTAASRSEVAVVGGVRVLSTKDSTLTSVNDTAFAIAAGLVRVNGALVTRVSTGLHWTHNGQHVTMVGTGDTIRYIAKSNGADTLIATHDFCLAGAKCADTVVARVNQVLLLTLSQRVFQSWSFSDSVGPSVTLADKRGTGLLGTSVRFVPAAPFDSTIVTVSPPIGTSNATNGQMAVPKLITTGNGQAKVYVLGIGADFSTVVAKDSVTVIERQVARRVQVEPLRMLVTANDSFPIRPLARDARGVPIADATVTITTSNISIQANGIWAGPTQNVTTPVFATITPDITGVALPANNPGAPQIPVAVDPSAITIIKPDTVTAGATARNITAVVLDSNAVPAFNKLVNLTANAGSFPLNVQADNLGQINFTWTPPDTIGFYTLTGVKSTTPLPVTVADSAGKFVVRQSVVVKADVPSSLKSTVAISATTLVNTTGVATVTVTVKDQFNNVVKTATPADFVATATNGTLGAATCSLGICTLTYTAPGAAGNDTIHVTIGGVDILFSPIQLTIN